MPTSSVQNGYHVFAIAGPPVFGGAKTWEFTLEVPVGAVTLIATGSIDLQTMDARQSTQVRVPIIGTIGQGEVSGNLNDGITDDFDMGGTVSGTVTLYFKDKWMWMNFDMKQFGKQYASDIKLIPLPV